MSHFRMLQPYLQIMKVKSMYIFSALINIICLDNWSIALRMIITCCANYGLDVERYIQQESEDLRE